MIPDRVDILFKIREYQYAPPDNISLQQYMANWLGSLNIPETVVVAGNEVSPKQQILDDLEGYLS